jgi:uncharacterized membrane protein YqiK
MDAIGLNDLMTLVNTVLCILLIILRLFWYRKNPKLDTLIHKLDSYVHTSLHAASRSNARPDAGLRYESNGEDVGVNNDNKTDI